MKYFVFAFGFVLGLAAQAHAEEVDFEEQVLPILQRRCIECHGPDKQKGDLRLDTKEGVFLEDYIVAPEEPDESELVIRILLPDDDEDKMPPKGDRLTKDQIELIRDWIRSGAVWPEGLVATRPEPPKQKNPLDLLATVDPTDAEAAALEKLAALGVSVRHVAADINWKTARLRGTPREVLDEALSALSQVTTLTDLNLADCELEDDDVAQLSSLTNLTRLHLENNSLTDAALAHLEPLVHLDYLNLYGTQVSDEGLACLKQMKHLRKLYVWQSQVTGDGVAALKRDLPNLDVVMGMEFAPPPPAAGDRSEQPRENQSPKGADGSENVSTD